MQKIILAAAIVAFSFGVAQAQHGRGGGPGGPGGPGWHGGGPGGPGHGGPGWDHRGPGWDRRGPPVGWWGGLPPGYGWCRWHPYDPTCIVFWR
jgi:hypothetical protein